MTTVYVDVTERGKALVTLPNGRGFIGREDGRYFAEVTEGESEGKSKFGLSSYKAGATWIARALGCKGRLNVVTDREYKQG